MSNKWLMIFLLLWINSCIEPFVLENDSYDKLLVVDGNVHNGPGPYIIKLSTSASIDRISFLPLHGCLVEIMDNEGNSFVLTETKTGQYETDSIALQGEVGKSYQLKILTPEGKTYQSSFETIKEPIAIDSVYAEYNEQTEFDTPFLRYGYQFYVDAATPQSDTNFVIWQLTSTYKFHADYRIFFFYDGAVKPFPNIDSLYYCYKTDRIPEIFTFNSKTLTSNEIKRKKLHFEDTRTKALTMNYSLLVNQMVVNEGAHDYWKSLSEINQSQGAVFAQQPYQVRGNIVCTSDTSENVLGYFMAAGLSQKRIFVTWEYEHWDYSECVITDVEYMAYADIFRSRPSQWPILITQGSTGGRAVVSDYCIDCRTIGAELEKPSFWRD
ncbi:MAG: DUF4249 domain-containing protein [Salibacteraceae bacterium]|nr:DUF4249 domain-containing protein [Salibacteraceae bacterium]